MDCVKIVNYFKHRQILSLDEMNLYNKAMHEYHIKFGYGLQKMQL